MKQQLLLLFTAFISFNTYSQISFEKGYFITNSGQKTDCLIKNIDWLYNPTDFKYKVSENSEPIDSDIKTVKEFGIYNSSKFIRATVKIDRSTENIQKLTYDRNPVFVEEQLFLKVLVEGQSNLYFYEDQNIKRFFFNNNNSDIEQLIYKIYLSTDENGYDVMTGNKYYKQQLWLNLKCPKIGMSKIEKLEYKKTSLTSFFTEYNNCNNSDTANHAKAKKDLFNLTVRPRLNSSSFSIDSKSTSVDFGNKSNFAFGVEAEFIMPYNKNKWAFAIETSYQSYKAENSADADDVSGGKLITTVDYSTIQVPVTVRYYSFINKNSKIFFNAFYLFDINLKSSLDFKRADNSTFRSESFKIRNSLGAGVGYKFIDKFSLEARYQAGKFVESNLTNRNYRYKTLSLIFGYSFF